MTCSISYITVRVRFLRLQTAFSPSTRVVSTSNLFAYIAVDLTAHPLTDTLVEPAWRASRGPIDYYLRLLSLSALSEVCHTNAESTSNVSLGCIAVIRSIRSPPFVGPCACLGLAINECTLSFDTTVLVEIDF